MSLVCEVYEMWLVLRLTFVKTPFNLKLNAVKVKLQLSVNGSQQILGLSHFPINITFRVNEVIISCESSECVWLSGTPLAGKRDASRRPDGIAGWMCDRPRARGQRGGRVCSADSNVSPRYQNFFINEGTQTSEGRVGVGRGRTRRRSANTPPQHSADSLFQTWQLVLFFLRSSAHPLACKLQARPRTMWLTIIIVFVKRGSGIFHNSPSYSWKWSWDTWWDTRGWIGHEVYGRQSCLPPGIWLAILGPMNTTSFRGPTYTQFDK